MKKFLLLASTALLFAGCAKELSTPNCEEGEIEVTVEAVAANATKAAADYDGQASKVNHWIMEVRDVNGKLFTRQEKDTAEGTKTQTFKVTLVKNQDYNFAFWADTKGKYVTDSLTAVCFASDITNLDELDAFSCTRSYTSTKSEKITAELTRPLAQLNFITTDLESLWTTTGGATDPTEYNKFEPVQFAVDASLPKKFNVTNQTAFDFDSDKLVLNAAKCYTGYESDGVTPLSDNNFKLHKNPATLLSAYVFATTSKGIYDINFGFYSNGRPVIYAFTSIPVQRNYRTNITGKLVTNDSDWEMTINPLWNNPEFTVPYYEATVDNIEALNQTLSSEQAAAAQEVTAKVTLPSDSNTKQVTFTEKNNDQTINLNFEGTLGSNKTITFQNDGQALTEGPKNLSITAPAGTSLVFNNPQSHVVINGSVYNNISGTFGVNSLIIDKDAMAANLSIAAGGLEIHGSVENVTVTGTAETVFVRSCEGLSEEVYNVLKPFIAKGYAGVENCGKYDIVLSNIWTNFAADAFSQIDNNAKTIKITSAEELALLAKNLLNNKTLYQGYKATLACDINLDGKLWTPAPAQGLKFDGFYHEIKGLKVNMDSNSLGLFGSVFNCDFENIIIREPQIGGTVAAHDYAGAICGNGYARITNCSVEGGSINASEQVGGIIGYLSCGSVTACKVNGMSLKGVNRVGGLVGKANVDSEYKVESNSVKNTTIYSSSRHDLSGSGALVAQIMTGIGAKWSISNNTVENVTTTTASDATFVPIGEFRKGCFDAQSGSSNISSNVWLPATEPGYYDLKNPEDPTEYVRILNKAYTFPFERNGVGYNKLSEAIAGAASGESIYVRKAGSYSLCNLPLDVEIIGMEGATFDCSAGGAICSIPNGCLFKDLKFKFALANYHGFPHAGNIFFENCAIEGQLTAYGEINFKNCTFSQAGDNYSVWTYGANVNFDGCTFNNYNKAILVYQENLPYDATVNVSNCTFNASATSDLKAAVQINAVNNAPVGRFIVNIDNSTNNGYNGLYGFKHSPRTVAAIVTVDGQVVYDQQPE